MYCGLNEAYDNSLKKQLKYFDNEKRKALEIAQMEDDVEKMQADMGVIPSYFKNEYIEPNIQTNYNNDFSGTNIDDIKSDGLTFDLNSENSSYYSDDDIESKYTFSGLESKLESNTMDDSTYDYNYKKKSKKNNKEDINYNKIAKRVMKNITDKFDYDSDNSDSSKSSKSSENTKEILKNFKNKIVKDTTKIKSNNNNNELFDNNIKEVIIIIVVGIFIIMLLDLFIRAGKIINK